MTSDSFRERGRALEDSFFAEQNRRLLEQLQEKVSAENARKVLSEASGVTDDAVLTPLIDNGVDAQTLSALTLVPLIRVAWADGRVDAKEREAVLHAAREGGIEKGGPAHALLNHWLDEEPPQQLFSAWQGYVRELSGRLDGRARAAVKADIVERARRVAESAGGVLGMMAVSSEEQAALNEIAAAFG